MERDTFFTSWYNFTRENKGLMSTSSHAVIGALYHLHDVSGLKEQFEAPTMLLMGYSGVKSYSTLNQVLVELESAGFLKVLSKPINRYMPRIVTFKGCARFANY